jgi:hypothetical protein
VRERPARLARDFGEGSSVSRVVAAEGANLSARKTRCAYVAATATRRKPVHIEMAGAGVKNPKKVQTSGMKSCQSDLLRMFFWACPMSYSRHSGFAIFEEGLPGQGICDFRTGRRGANQAN